MNKIIETIKSYVLSNMKECAKSYKDTFTKYCEMWGDGDSYSFFFIGREFPNLTRKDIKDLAEVLKATFNEKGFKYETEKIYFDGYKGLYSSPDVLFPTKVTWTAKPCKEFNTLNKMLKKYCGKELDPEDVYEVRLFGKRGSYGENGSKNYLCHSSFRCKSYINFIRLNKTTRDILTFETKTIDDIDTDHSSRYETECYGNRFIELRLTVKTPKGKVKAYIP